MGSKAYWEKCATGKALRTLIEDTLPENVHVLRRPAEAVARAELIRAGKAYCLATCGGCPMTDNVPPP